MPKFLRQLIGWLQKTYAPHTLSEKSTPVFPGMRRSEPVLPRIEIIKFPWEFNNAEELAVFLAFNSSEVAIILDEVLLRGKNFPGIKYETQPTGKLIRVR